MNLGFSTALCMRVACFPPPWITSGRPTFFLKSWCAMAAVLSGSITGGSVSFADLGSTDDAPALSAKNSESLLEEFEIEVEEKVKQMRSLTERLALRLDRNFQLELLKLPPSIRSNVVVELSLSVHCSWQLTVSELWLNTESRPM